MNPNFIGVLSVLFGLISLPAVAVDRPSVVAVFDIEVKGVGLSADDAERLSDYLSGRIGEGGRFLIVPRERIKQTLAIQKSESYRDCYAQSCQIELGLEMAANRTLSTQIYQLGSHCKVSLAMYDLAMAATLNTATVSGACDTDSVVASIDKAVDKLLGFESSYTRSEDNRIVPKEVKTGQAEKFTPVPPSTTKGRLLVEADQPSVYIGLRPVRQPSEWMELPSGIWPVTVAKPGFKTVFKKVGVPAEQGTVYHPDLKRDDSKPDWTQIPDWTTEGFGPDKQFFAYGHGQSLNPVLADFYATGMALLNMASEIEAEVDKQFVPYVEISDPVECEGAPVCRLVRDHSVSTAMAAGLKTNITRYLASGNGLATVGLTLAAVGDTFIGQNRKSLNGYYIITKVSDFGSAIPLDSVAPGNVLGFKGKEIQCSARLGALMTGIFKSVILPNGVDVQATTDSLQSSFWGDSDSYSYRVSSKGKVGFHRKDLLGDTEFSVSGEIRISGSESKARADVIPTELESVQAEMALTTTLRGQPFEVQLVDGIVESVNGLNSCDAASEIAALLKASGWSVVVSDLADSPYGVPLSRVAITR